MSDELEHLLDTLDRRSSEPAPAFIHAVTRRRRRRRLTQAGSVAALLVAAAGVWVAMQGVRPTPGSDTVIVEATRPPSRALANTSLASLTRANRERDSADLALPVSPGSGEADPLRLGLRCDTARFEQWLTQ